MKSVNSFQVGGATKNARLLLVTAVRLREGPNGLQIDDQTAAGMQRWAEHFCEVTYVGIAKELQPVEDTSVRWVDISSLPCAAQLRVIALPMAYKLGAFARTYRKSRQVIATEIRQARHLCFTVGYLVGDWAAIAALEATAQRRKFGIWFDRVEHEVIGRTVSQLPLKRQIKERVTLLFLKHYHYYLTRRSSVALLQGMDTFNVYAPYANRPACVYDVHTGPQDFPSDIVIGTKRADILSKEPLRIVYAGRAVAMKGPRDWLEAIATALNAGVNLHATWIGDGPLLVEMQERCVELGIQHNVTLRGHVHDREELLSELSAAHLMLFCHKTPESPRSLIEALVSACPIVGYDSAYAQGLIERGGGWLTPLNDIEELGASLVYLDRHRHHLADLVDKAALVGKRFEEGGLYAERAALIAAHT